MPDAKDSTNTEGEKEGEKEKGNERRRRIVTLKTLHGYERPRNTPPYQNSVFIHHKRRLFHFAS